MTDTLAFVFESELSDKLIRFLRSRGARAHIYCPTWLRDRIAATPVPDTSAHGPTWTDFTRLKEAPLPDGDVNVFVITDTAEEEAAAVDYLRTRGHSRAIGFFSRLVPAIICGSAPLKQWASPPQHRFAIFCVPRSGSRYLATTLTSLGVGKPQEHVREPLGYIISRGGLSFSSAIKTLERFGQANGIFGTKLISTFALGASSDQFSQLSDNIGRMVDRGYRFVHLTRALEDVAVSNYIANKLNKWHFFGELAPSQQERLESIAFDEAAAWKGFIRLNAQQIITSRISEKYGMLHIGYPDLESDVDAAVSLICGQMGVELSSLRAQPTSIPIAARGNSSTYERFGACLRELIDTRRNEIEPSTITELSRAAHVGIAKARRLTQGPLLAGAAA